MIWDVPTWPRCANRRAGRGPTAPTCSGVERTLSRRRRRLDPWRQTDPRRPPSGSPTGGHESGGTLPTFADIRGREMLSKRTTGRECQTRARPLGTLGDGGVLTDFFEKVEDCMCGTIPPPLHTPRSVVPRTSSPGLGRTVCGHGRQVRAQPGLGGSLLLHRRVCLRRSAMTIRLARCAAASIGANRSAIEVTHFSKA